MSAEKGNHECREGFVETPNNNYYDLNLCK